jgi:hypothetical protein
MLRYFDKTFFRFLFGFAGILAVSFAILLIVGYYEVELKAEVDASDGTYDYYGE